MTALPLSGYDVARVGDPDPVTMPPYTYRAKVTSVYDADTLILSIDLGFHTWVHDEKVRLAGINSNEIKRSSAKGHGDDHIAVGFDARDFLLKLLGVPDSEMPPHKVSYHELERPVEVIIQTLKDKSGKFGRILGIINKDGVNINQAIARAGYAEVNWYDGHEYHPATPITPDGPPGS